MFYHMHLISVIIITQRHDSHVFECVYPTNTICSVSGEGGEESREEDHGKEASRGGGEGREEEDTVARRGRRR